VTTLDKRFVFRANAIGVAGQITRPQSAVRMHGASSLPVVGGYAQSDVQRTQLEDVFEFESAWTETSGDFSKKEKAYKTLATAYVKGLNVTNRLTADLIEATISSTQPVDGGDPSIVPKTVRIENLRLDGYPIKMRIDKKLFTSHATKQSLATAYETDDKFHTSYGHRFHVSSTAAPRRSSRRRLPELSGCVCCSIVDKVTTTHPEAQINDHAITLEGFGTIYLGEFLITDISRRLTLLRLKLGSPVAGDLACAEVESNGILII